MIWPSTSRRVRMFSPLRLISYVFRSVRDQRQTKVLRRSFAGMSGRFVIGARVLKRVRDGLMNSSD